MPTCMSKFGLIYIFSYFSFHKTLPSLNPKQRGFSPNLRTGRKILPKELVGKGVTLKKICHVSPGSTGTHCHNKLA